MGYATIQPPFFYDFFVTIMDCLMPLSLLLTRPADVGWAHVFIARHGGRGMRASLSLNLDLLAEPRPRKWLTELHLCILAGITPSPVLQSITQQPFPICLGALLPMSFKRFILLLPFSRSLFLTRAYRKSTVTVEGEAGAFLASLKLYSSCREQQNAEP